MCVLVRCLVCVEFCVVLCCVVLCRVAVCVVGVLSVVGVVVCCCCGWCLFVVYVLFVWWLSCGVFLLLVSLKMLFVVCRPLFLVALWPFAMDCWCWCLLCVVRLPVAAGCFP